MNEVVIVVHNGDSLDTLIKTGIEIVKIKTVSYALITFNNCKLFVKKDSTIETINEDYKQRLRATV